MAPPQGHVRASRYFAALIVIVTALWVGVAFWAKTSVPKLGLDLEGGTSLTLSTTDRGVDPDELEQARDIIANRVHAIGIAEAEVVIEGDDTIVVNVPDGEHDVAGIGEPGELLFREVLATTENVSQPPPSPSASASPSESASPAPSGSATPSASASPTGSPSAAAPSQTPSASSSAEGTEQDLLQRVYTKLGEGDPKKGEELVNQVMMIQDPAQIAENEQAMAYLAGFGELTSEEVAVLPADVQFNVPTITCDQLKSRPYGAVGAPNDKVAACDAEGETKYLLDRARVLDSDVADAAYGTDTKSGSGWLVSIEFTGEGQKRWTRLTADATNREVALVMDNTVVAAPKIEERSLGNAEIGGLTKAEAAMLTAQLRHGTLPVTFKVEAHQQISPTLGADVMRAALIAAVLGLVLVLGYGIVAYRALGVVVAASLLAAAAVVYPSLVLLGEAIGFTLSLAGVAGLMIAIGITADSFVVFLERLKSEVGDGRTLRSAVARAWSQARRTILTANAVVVIVAAALYFVAVGAIKNFALTLGVAAVADLVIVFLLTHPLVGTLARSRRFAIPRLSETAQGGPAPKRAARVRGAVRTKES